MYLPNFSCHFLPLWKIFQFKCAAAQLNLVHPQSKFPIFRFNFPFLIFNFFAKFAASCPVCWVGAQCFPDQGNLSGLNMPFYGGQFLLTQVSYQPFSPSSYIEVIYATLTLPRDAFNQFYFSNFRQQTSMSLEGTICPKIISIPPKFFQTLNCDPLSFRITGRFRLR